MLNFRLLRICLSFILSFSILFSLSGHYQNAFAKTRRQNVNIQTVPSPNCLGSSNNICNPTPSLSVTPTQTEFISPTNDPCNATNSVEAHSGSKHHRKHANGQKNGIIGSSMQQLIALLLQLLSQLFAQLGITNPFPVTPVPVPTTPIMPTEPAGVTTVPDTLTLAPSSQTTNPCPSATQPVNEPSVTQVAPSGTTPATSPAPTQPVTTTWWKPTADKPMQLHWQLSGKFNPATDFVTGATVYDIDGEQATAADVAAIHAKGYKAICYFDAGVYEDYRSDASSFPKSVIGSADAGWQGSFWLDIRQINILKPIMENRIKNWCQAKGFDAIEPDETEVWDNNPGFPITQADNIAYGKMFADLVHSYNMSVGLKGNNAEAASYVNFTDWSLSEQCYEYSECDNLHSTFVAQNKAVWIVEYNVTPNCTDANTKHMNAMKRDLNLVGPTAGGYLFQPCKPTGSTTW